MKLLCGQCGGKLDCDPEPGQSHVPCPHCGHEIPLASPTETDPAAVSTGPGPIGEGEGFAGAARNAMRKTVRLRVQCGGCGKSLQVSVRRAGKTVRCPSCRADIRIPWPEDEDEFELEALADRHGPGDEQLELSPVDQVEQLAEQSLRRAESLAAQPPTKRTRRPRSEVLARARRGRRRDRRLWIWLGAAACLAGLIVLLVVLLGPENRDTGQDQARAGSQSPSAGPEPLPNPPARQRQPDPQPDPPVQPIRNPGPKPAAAKHIGTDLQAFLHAGRRPAGPRKVWWKVFVGLRAGDQPLDLDPAADAVLRGPDGPIACLGQIDAGRILAKRVRLGPGRYRAVTLIFQVPADLRRARLDLAAAGHLDLTADLSSIVPDPAGPGPEGRYRETPPRNLKPLPAEKPLARVQKAYPLTIEIRTPAGNDRPVVRLGPLGWTGPAETVGPGLYRADLQGPGGRLRVHLRHLADDRLILYLRDEPFHQVTFAPHEPGPPVGPQPD